MNKKQEILKNICKKNKGKLESISRSEAQVTKEISELENTIIDIKNFKLSIIKIILTRLLLVTTINLLVMIYVYISKGNNYLTFNKMISVNILLLIIYLPDTLIHIKNKILIKKNNSLHNLENTLIEKKHLLAKLKKEKQTIHNNIIAIERNKINIQENWNKYNAINYLAK